MSVSVIGMISHRLQSEIHQPGHPEIDLDYLDRFARAHDEGGFDRILIGYYSDAPDGFLIAARAAFVTERVGLMLAHRPGFVAPTLAARKLATLDHLSRGRAAVHIISGGSDADQRKDGDYLGHDERYARTDEYVGILRRLWTADAPFDHEGRFYRFTAAAITPRPLQKPHIPIYFGGSSPAAIAVAGRHADIFALWGESREQATETIQAVRAAAAGHGRKPGFSLSFRPIIAPTEAEAWAKAESILERTMALRRAAGLPVDNHAPENAGSRRLLDAARRGGVVDERLYTAIAAATGARGNTTALVGTPDQVVEALLAYWELGVETFLIRGFEPLNDAIDYGREIVPRLKAEVARREAWRQQNLARRTQ